MPAKVNLQPQAMTTPLKAMTVSATMSTPELCVLHETFFVTFFPFVFSEYFGATTFDQMEAKAKRLIKKRRLEMAEAAVEGESDVPHDTDGDDDHDKGVDEIYEDPELDDVRINLARGLDSRSTEDSLTIDEFSGDLVKLKEVPQFICPKT